MPRRKRCKSARNRNERLKLECGEGARPRQKLVENDKSGLGESDRKRRKKKYKERLSLSQTESPDNEYEKRRYRRIRQGAGSKGHDSIHSRGRSRKDNKPHF